MEVVYMESWSLCRGGLLYRFYLYLWCLAQKSTYVYCTCAITLNLDTHNQYIREHGTVEETCSHVDVDVYTQHTSV